MRIRLYFIAFVLLQLTVNNVVGQKSIVSESVERSFLNAKKLYSDGQYSAASSEFKRLLSQEVTINVGIREEMEHLYHISNFKSDKEGALGKLKVHAETTHNKHYSDVAWFEIAKYYLQRDDYKRATRSFVKGSPKSFNADMQNEYLFKYGYAFAMTGNVKKAMSSLEKVASKKNAYYNQANYFLGYVYYNQKKYTKSLASFKRVGKGSEFESSIAYFRLQIYYHLGQHDKIIQVAPGLLKTVDESNKASVAKILGFTYFTKKDYEKASEYYEIYKSLTKDVSRSDIYYLATANYYSGDFEKASEAYAQVATLDDELTQNAYYNLGNAYLKAGDKQLALMAYEAASKFSFDKNVQEEASFKFAKLSYQINYSAFNDIIETLENFTKTFPNSEYKADVYDLLANAYLTSNNYKKAYESLIRIEVASPRLKNAMQRVAYYRASELFNDHRFAEAVKFYTKSIKNGAYDKELRAKALYWRGESYFHVKDYGRSEKDFRDFIMSHRANELTEYSRAYYNLGYVFFKQNRPDESIEWFTRFIIKNRSNSDHYSADAYVRMGDAFFLKRDFTEAIMQYNLALKIGSTAPDYTLYQKAFCYGLMKRYQNKIMALNDLTRIYPNSPYADDALFERGKTYVQQGNKIRGKENFQDLINAYPHSEHVPATMIQLALLNYNTGHKQEAIALYKKVVENYPDSEEAKSSLEALKTIFIDNNRVDEYIAYSKTVNNGNISTSEEDSLTYRAAEKLYMTGNIDNSIAYLDNYIKAFPDGAYKIEAHYFKADCYLRKGNEEAAIEDLKYIVELPFTKYSVESLRKLIDIYMEDDYYVPVIPLTHKMLNFAQRPSDILNTTKHQLICYYYTEQYDSAVYVSERLMKMPNANNDLLSEVLFYQGKSFLALGNTQEAYESLSAVEGPLRLQHVAEAKVITSEMDFERNNVKEAGVAMENYVKQSTTHQYWLARAFILLSKIRIHEGNDIEAKQYLLSVRDNYTKEDDIQPTVVSLLNEIEERENIRYQARRDSLLKLLNSPDSIE